VCSFRKYLPLKTMQALELACGECVPVGAAGEVNLRSMTAMASELPRDKMLLLLQQVTWQLRVCPRLALRCIVATLPSSASMSFVSVSSVSMSSVSMSFVSLLSVSTSCRLPLRMPSASYRLLWMTCCQRRTAWTRYTHTAHT
jgi:hypothetical protein